MRPKYILEDIEELVQQKVITTDTADQIKKYYSTKSNSAPHRLFIVFGIIGALLVGMGIVLIVAHNWDNLNKFTQVFLALLPLLLGQTLCGYALLKKSNHPAWRESTAAFLVFAIATAISVVSQVYQIEGDLQSFLLTWMILTLPIIYVMHSSLAFLLFLSGVTWYACEVGYFRTISLYAWRYWMLLALALPFYIIYMMRSSKGNFFHFKTWLICISLTITLGLFHDHSEEILVLAYIALFAIFINAGQLPPFSNNKLRTNAPLIIGSLGTIVLLLVLSFEWFWVDTFKHAYDTALYIEFRTTWITALMATVLLFFVQRRYRWQDINAKSIAFIIVLLLFLFHVPPLISQVMVNLMLFFLGVFTITDGARKNRLDILNYGLLILTALILCRFFDLDISFVIRGLMFVTVGVGFFVANYAMIRRRRASINHE